MPNVLPEVAMKDRIRELIKEHDEHPDPKLGGLNYYATYTKICMEVGGIKWLSELSCWHSKPDEKVWDLLSESERQCIRVKADTLIKDVIANGGKENA